MIHIELLSRTLQKPPIEKLSLTIRLAGARDQWLLIPQAANERFSTTRQTIYTATAYRLASQPSLGFYAVSGEQAFYAFHIKKADFVVIRNLPVRLFSDELIERPEIEISLASTVGVVDTPLFDWVGGPDMAVSCDADIDYTQREAVYVRMTPGCTEVPIQFAYRRVFHTRIG